MKDQNKTQLCSNKELRPGKTEVEVADDTTENPAEKRRLISRK